MRFIASLMRWLEGEETLCIICGCRHRQVAIESDGIGVCCGCYDDLMKNKATDYFEVCGPRRLFAPFKYEGNLRAAIWELKFGGSVAYAKIFARLVVDALPPYYDFSAYDLIMPVPLHSTRFSCRGFNQAELIAGEIGRILNIPMVNNALLRTKQTMHQMRLSKVLRNMNVRCAFTAVRTMIEGKRILIVDDIYTAGATIRECAAELYDKGALEVSAIVLSGNFSNQKDSAKRAFIPRKL